MLVGSMDGSLSLLDAASGAVLHSEKAHQKYVVRVRWAPHGDRFVSASRDGTIAAYELIGAALMIPIGNEIATLRLYASYLFCGLPICEMLNFSASQGKEH